MARVVLLLQFSPCLTDDPFTSIHVSCPPPTPGDRQCEQFPVLRARHAVWDGRAKRHMVKPFPPFFPRLNFLPVCLLWVSSTSNPLPRPPSLPPSFLPT